MKNQKLSLIAALALGGLLAFTASTSAQDTNRPKRPAGKAPSVEQRVDRMSSELNLTADQKTKVTSLFESENKKLQDIRQNTANLGQDERRQKFLATREETDKQLKEILKPDQWEKWQKVRQQMRPGGNGEKKGAGKKAE